MTVVLSNRLAGLAAKPIFQNNQTEVRGCPVNGAVPDDHGH